MLRHIRKFRNSRVIHVINYKIYFFICRIFEKHVYTVRYGIIKGLKRRGGLGFIPYIRRPSKEDVFFKQIMLEGLIIYDVGAAFGIYTMFFSKSVGEVGRVIAFEPNPILYKQIKENLKINKLNNVDVKKMALGKNKKMDTLVFPRTIPGVGSIQKNEKTRMLKLKDAYEINVNLDTIDNLIDTKQIPIPNLVKIDVQGLELDILFGMKKTIRKYYPKIFIEVHYIPYVNWKVINLYKIVDFLITEGYLIYHVESGLFINYNNYKLVDENDHLYSYPACAHSSSTMNHF